MHIKPIVILDGEDVSRWFISCHMEQTANSSKDPGKYDLVLANPSGRFLGSFAPKSVEEITEEELGNFELAPKKRVSLQIVVSNQGCEGNSSTTINSGERRGRSGKSLPFRVGMRAKPSLITFALYSTDISRKR